MSFTAPHIGFVLVSYGFSALVLGGLILSILWQWKQTSSRLSELEARSAAQSKSNDQVSDE